MRLIHENLTEEAEAISNSVREVLGIECQTLNSRVDDAFTPIEEFVGFKPMPYFLRDTRPDFFPSNKRVMILTERDIYSGSQSKDDDWLFGMAWEGIFYVSTARLKRRDSMPSASLEISTEEHLKRVIAIALHEIGHDIVEGSHLKNCCWYNAKTKYVQGLGQHCVDNTCIMYEPVSIETPKPEDGFLSFGEGDNRFDAGLDDHLIRVRKDWFCGECKGSVQIDDRFR